MASPSNILECIRFALKLGNKSLPVKALSIVLPHLGPDAMLFDNIIMKAFGAKLDWATERLPFKDSSITIPATPTRQPIRLRYCSVITQDSDTEDAPVYVSNKYVVSAAHEALIHSFVSSAQQDLKKIR